MRYFSLTIILAFTLLVLFSCASKEEPSVEPVAAFTISPSSGPFTSIFTFNGSSSSDSDDPVTSLMVRWDWEGDGDFDTEYSYTKVIDHQYEQADYYNVTMEVINSKGWTDQEVKVLQVFADSIPPTAAFTVSPDTSGVGTISLFSSASSSDPYTPTPMLKYRWDWQADGKWDTPYSKDTNIYKKYTVAGEYRIRLEVMNDVMLTDTISHKIVVYDF